MRFLISAFVLFLGIISSEARAAGCDTPYKTLRSDGRCVWSCAAGTAPDTSRDECSCKAGHSETGNDRFGRRICTAETSEASGVRKRIKQYSARYPFNTAPVNLCARFADHDEPGWPIKCNVRPGRVHLRVLRPLEIVVQRGAPMEHTKLVPGSYRFSFTPPKAPKRIGGHCDESLISVPGACRVICERMEMYGFFDQGNIAILSKADHRQIDRCEGPLTLDDYRITSPSIARAWDACVNVAEQRGLDRWGHDTQIVIPRRVATDFGFRDPRTTRLADGWQYVKKINHVIRDATVSLPIIVHCRP